MRATFSAQHKAVTSLILVLICIANYCNVPLRYCKASEAALEPKFISVSISFQLMKPNIFVRFNHSNRRLFRPIISRNRRCASSAPTGGGYAQIDETPVDYLEPGNGKTKQGYLWTCSRPGGDVFFRWETSRAAVCLNNIIPVDFTGTVQCDGYPAYRSFANARNGTIALAGCWAHVRRKFFEAEVIPPLPPDRLPSQRSPIAGLLLRFR